MVTLILVQHQPCKQQLVRMSRCGEEDREEENRREGRGEERKGRVNEEGGEGQPETERNSRTTTKVDMRHWLWR